MHAGYPPLLTSKAKAPDVHGDYSRAHRWLAIRRHSHVDRSGGCRNNLLTITQWGCLQLGNKGAYFKGCKQVNCAARDALDLKETTNLESMFYGASSFTSDLSAWQTGQVTNMCGMFYGASSFTSDLSVWQTGQVTNMCGMFYDASSFTSDLSAWQTCSVAHPPSQAIYPRGKLGR